MVDRRRLPGAWDVKTKDQAAFEEALEEALAALRRFEIALVLLRSTPALEGYDVIVREGTFVFEWRS